MFGLSGTDQYRRDVPVAFPTRWKRRVCFAFLLGASLFSSGKPAQNKLRIVAMAPNTAEIIYSLGLGDQVVGVNRFTAWPKEAAEKPSVGGTYDPNYEKILSLRPDLVVGLESQEEIAGKLRALGVDFVGVPHERISEIMESIRIIGRVCGAEEKAESLFQSLKTRLNHLSSEPSSTRILVCVGHDETLSRMYVAGKNTFYDDLIELAGASNACDVTIQKYPEISPEGLRSMNPDLVINIAPGTKNDPDELDKLWQPWKTVTITNSYAAVPGPRFISLLEDFTRAVQQQSKSK